jgi:hypothetical protein
VKKKGRMRIKRRKYSNEKELDEKDWKKLDEE